MNINYLDHNREGEQDLLPRPASAGAGPIQATPTHEVPVYDYPPSRHRGIRKQHSVSCASSHCCEQKV